MSFILEYDLFIVKVNTSSNFHLVLTTKMDFDAQKLQFRNINYNITLKNHPEVSGQNPNEYLFSPQVTSSLEGKKEKKQQLIKQQKYKALTILA